jgi:hypothetical protein
MTINGTSGLVFNDASTQNTAATGFGFKNRLINSDMRIDQRNAGASVTPTDGQYLVDRWQGLQAVASKYSAQQNAGAVTPPVGFTNYLGATSLSSYSVGASEYFALRQSIEGFNVADLGWGTANAVPITLSFWVRSSLTGTFGGALQNAASNRFYAFSYSISSANTWEQKTVIIAGDTTGTWATNNTAGLRLTFGIGVGSTLSIAAGVWGATAALSATGATSVVGTNGATFYITGVQLEKGSTATSFDYRPYGTELALCQRYCINYRSADSASAYYTYGYGNNLATTRCDVGFRFPVQMRVTPTLTTTGTAANYAIYEAVGVVGCSAIPYISAGNQLNAQIVATTAGSLTAGRGSSLISNNNNTSYLLFTAEL